MNDQSINAFYTEDHARLDGLFEQFQARGRSDPGQARKYFTDFHTGLARHIAWEEEIVFPAFERRIGHTGGPTQVMRWEHQQLRGILEAISAKLARGDADTTEETAALGSLLEAHNHKEERILYPMIDQVNSAEERAEMFVEMNRSP